MANPRDRSIRPDVDKSPHEARFVPDQRILNRLQVGNNHHDPFYIDPNDWKPGMVYAWFRESLLGVPDRNRIPAMKELGWEPVPVERHPEVMGGDFLGRNSHLSGYIAKGGLLLMERHRYYEDIERQSMDRYNQQLVNRIPGQDHFMDEPRMPMRVLANQTTNNYSDTF